MSYVVSYVTIDGFQEETLFEGCWTELKEFVKTLREEGCTNIQAGCCGWDE